MLWSPRKNGLDSLFKEVRVFKEGVWQERDKKKLKSDRNARKSDQKCINVVELLLPTSFCGTLIIFSPAIFHSFAPAISNTISSEPIFGKGM